MKNLILLIIVILVALSCNRSKEPLYKNPDADIDKRVEDLLKRMTLDEKVAQLKGYLIFDTLAWDKEGNFVLKDSLLYNGAGSVFSWQMRSRL